MDMKINAAVVKNLRTKNCWSQQELAIACGLSLRTIQRIEAKGQGSPESIKALAAVFEVEHDTLKYQYAGAHGYRNIQLGYVLIAVFMLIAFGLLWSFIEGQLCSSAFAGLSLLNALICALFSTMTTKVDGAVIEWHFTFGFLRKSIPLAQVQSSQEIRNKVWWGIGIRLIPDGWLYSVSGLDAVLLRLQDGTVYRVGTDEPKQFNAAIENALLRLSRDE